MNNWVSYATLPAPSWYPVRVCSASAVEGARRPCATDKRGFNKMLAWNIGAVILGDQFAGSLVEFGIDPVTAGKRRSTYDRVMVALALEKRLPEHFHPCWLIGREMMVETNNERISGSLRTVATNFVRSSGVKIPELGETDGQQQLFDFVLRMLTGN